MTGKIIDRETAGLLVLIIPFAIAVVIFFTAWKWILLFIGLTILWNIWQSYLWVKWSEKVNPFFTQLIRENQGCLTPMDLSLKANLNGKTAKRFLDKKAEEFGPKKVLDDQGIVYYFLTAGALGRIFDDSEPGSEPEVKAIPSSTNPSFSTLESTTPSTNSFMGKILGIDESEATLVEEEPEETQPQEQTSSETSADQSPSIKASSKNLPPPLIQSDLAKRLDANPSTVGRHKSTSGFAQWSRSKDPEGIAWKYVPKTQMFVPVDTEDQ